MPRKPPCKPLGLELNEHTGFCIKPCKDNEERVSIPPYNCTQKEKTRLAMEAAEKKIREDNISSRFNDVAEDVDGGETAEEEKRRKKREEERRKKEEEERRKKEEALRKKKEEEALKRKKDLQDILDKQKERNLNAELKKIQKNIRDTASKTFENKNEILRLNAEIKKLTELSTTRTNEHKSKKEQIISNVESIRSMTLANESSQDEIENNNMSVRDIVGQINDLSAIGKMKKEEMGAENLKLEDLMGKQSILDDQLSSLFTVGEKLFQDLTNCLNGHREPEETEPEPEEPRPRTPGPIPNLNRGWVCTTPYPKSTDSTSMRTKSCKPETGGEPFDNVPGLFNGTKRIAGARFVGRQPCIETCYHNR